MTLVTTADLWWKNSLIYSLDVETFADSDGDGIGDFQGLIERIDHLAGLGVDCIWLMPFYPTANRDDGYDVCDHYAVDDRLGTLGDFTEFVDVARSRGIRVIADLVVNHTSTGHRWFQEARSSRNSPYREFYVWRDEVPEDGPTGLVFPGQQKELWTWDDEAAQYYLHRFYRHQPDLNIASERVRRELRKVLRFWLQQGLSGFRIDAVPFLLETEGIEEEMELPAHDYLRNLRSLTNRRRQDAVLLGEVNLPPEEQRRYFGDEDGDELHMLFDFVGMQASYLSFARRSADPLRKAIDARLSIPEENSFAVFLRNHDELTLDKLTDSERQEVFDAFGPDTDMQLFDRGLRRRLPPMFDGDQRRIRMAYSLMFSLPGAPSLFYGEEIGMGENLDIEGRRAVRSPMQWRSGPSGGFSSAAPADLVRPLPKGPYGPDEVNVSVQQSEPDSLLNWFERLIRVRRESPEIGFGDHEVLDVDVVAIFGMRYEWEDRRLITLHNLDERVAEAQVQLEPGFRLVDLLSRSSDGSTDLEQLDPGDGGGTVTVRLSPYDHRWLRVERS